MRERRVILLASAENDLNEIADWLIEFSSETTATAYLHRLKGRIGTLANASERGTLRGEVPGLRIIGIMHGVSVAFVVDGDEVVVHRTLYRGRSFQPAVSPDDPD